MAKIVKAERGQRTVICLCGLTVQAPTTECPACGTVIQWTGLPLRERQAIAPKDEAARSLGIKFWNAESVVRWERAVEALGTQQVLQVAARIKKRLHGARLGNYLLPILENMVGDKQVDEEQSSRPGPSVSDLGGLI